MESILRFLRFSKDDGTTICRATGLTEKQKKLVQSTWAPVKGEASVGSTVMITLFKKHPKYQEYFSAFKDTPLSELPNNKRFQAHCVSVMSGLNSVIDALYDSKLLEVNLSYVASMHKNKHRPTTEELQHLKGVILEVIESAFGEQYTSEVAEAWSKTLDAAFTKLAQLCV